MVVQPIGIDPEWIGRMKQIPGVIERSKTLKDSFNDRKVILGLETIDQSSGLIHKLRAFDKLFKLYPEWQGQVMLIQVVFPTGDPKQKLETKVTELIADINGAHGNLAFTPVQLHNQAVDTEEYISLLSTADMLLITSERDSVNTLILDYIASQDGSFGVPVISEFIGLASFLPSRFNFNPWDHTVANYHHQPIYCYFSSIGHRLDNKPSIKDE